MFPVISYVLVHLFRTSIPLFQPKKDHFPFRTCAVQEVRAKFESMSHGAQLSSHIEWTERLIGKKKMIK